MPVLDQVYDVYLATQCNIEKQRPYKTWPSKNVVAVNNLSIGSLNCQKNPSEIGNNQNHV